jgi:hypothetical protein
MRLKSIFGAYADNLQVVVDSRNDRFDPLWFPEFFGIAPPQMQLTFSEAIGTARIEAVASVVDRDSETPLRSRPDLKKLEGSIPAIKEMFSLKESDMRDFEIMKAMPVSDKVKLNQILDFIYNDSRKAGNSVYKRIDMMCLEAVSTGKISINTTNNPDGIVSDDIDLLMNSGNKANAAISWDTAATATPIDDILARVQYASDNGFGIAKMLMTKTLFGKMIKTKQVIDTLTAFYYAAKPGASFNPVGITTLANVNNYLSESQLPIIELVDKAFGVEKDGKILIQRPFNQNNVAFVPAGQLGVIKNALAMEEIRPVENVTYAKFGSALLSKWHENEPLREWTKAEWNAFPALSAIDSMQILTAVYS